MRRALERGEIVQILKHGRVVAQLVPDSDFMSGKEMARFFAHHKADPETADAIERELQKLNHGDYAMANGRRRR